MMRNASRFFGALILLTFLFSFTKPGEKISHPKALITVAPFTNMENEIFKYINLHRKSIGLNPLQLNTVESSVAAKHSYEMATGKTPFGHEGLKKRMSAIARQIGFISATGENVAYGKMSAWEVVDGWLHSPGHKRNIEGNFTRTGIGVASDKKGMLYYTQIFTK